MRLILVILLSLAAAAQDVADSSTGFEQQYRPVVDALRAGDHAAAKRALDSFALPPEWFQQMFGTTAEAVQQQYKFEFDYFEYSEPRWIERQLADSPTRFQEEVLAESITTRPPAKPAPASIQPLPAVKHILFRAYSDASGANASDGKNATIPIMTRVNSFAYADGSFRFFGVGGYPFWDPVRVRRPDMCDPQGRQPGGQLVNPVAPTYPPEARNKGIQGAVVMRVNVAKDGSVSEVYVMSGDELLAQSATAATKQWHYTPFMNCGAPMEAQSIEKVNYSISSSGSAVEIEQPSKTVRISSGVAARLLKHQVNPKYSPEARQARLQGAVVLLIKIGKDGLPQIIKQVSGNSELGSAAIDAVRQWRYTPYKLNGEPVEVETSVQINFTLSGS